MNTLKQLQTADLCNACEEEEIAATMARIRADPRLAHFWRCVPSDLEFTLLVILGYTYELGCDDILKGKIVRKAEEVYQ